MYHKQNSVKVDQLTFGSGVLVVSLFMKLSIDRVELLYYT